MLKIRKILHATDFSAASRPALDQALLWAELHEAPLVLLNVLTLRTADPFNPEHHFPEPDELAKRLEALASSEMKTLLAPHRERPLDIKELVRTGFDPEKEILAVAGELGADLIVLGTHGRRGPAHLLLGSVAASVLRGADCPVLVVPSRRPHPVAALKRILAPVDFSDASRKAVKHAAALALATGARLDLLHVIPPLDAALPMNLGGIGAVSIVSDLEPAAKAELERMVAELPAGVSAESAVWHGAVVGSILNRAQESAADLIVIGTTGRTGLDRLLLGSVAENVARLAEVPALVVPPEGRSLVG